MFISAYQKLGGMVWIPRMLEKIRVNARGELPPDYLPFLGKGFDGRCVAFLHVDYAALVERTLSGGTDEEILAWCLTHRSAPTETEMLVWNEYMMKRGFRDTDRPEGYFEEYKQQHGLGHRAEILTFFEFYEVDEGRKP